MDDKDLKALTILAESLIAHHWERVLTTVKQQRENLKGIRIFYSFFSAIKMDGASMIFFLQTRPFPRAFLPPLFTC